MPRRNALSALALGAVLCLAACGSDHPSASPAWVPARVPLAQGSLGPGFWDDPSGPPPPEGTITPSPGSWDGVHPAAGYRVALLIDGVRSGSREQTAVLRAAVREWAHSVDASITEFVATKATTYVATIQSAIDAHADLVISVGNGLVDPVAMVSAPNPDTSFLIVGSQIAEPTPNVTATDWVGAMFRGEGLGLPEGYDPESFTPERAGRAVRAGVAAVLSGLNGTVVEIS